MRPVNSIKNGCELLLSCSSIVLKLFFEKAEDEFTKKISVNQTIMSFCGDVVRWRIIETLINCRHRRVQQRHEGR